MIKHNLRTFAYIIFGLGFLTYTIIFLITQDLNNINYNNAVKHILTTISINIILWTIFIKWAWKWKIFYPWLVQVPNLSGKWEGTLKSNWDDGKLDPISTDMTINQSFLHIQIKINTGESRSHSVGASFDIDEERGYQQLFYSYVNTPKPSVRDRSEIHYGTTLLHFDGFEVESLEGEYWTSRETTGELELKKVKDKHIA
jgi:hypothetical protein